METLTFSPIEPFILMAFGIGIIAIDIMITTFVIIWFGLSLCIIGAISIYVEFDSGYTQLIFSSLLTLMLAYSLKNRFSKEFLNPKDEEIEENFFNVPGKAIMVEKYMIKYKDQFFYINPDIDFNIEQNMEVNVISIKNGIATISEIEKIND